MESPGDEASDPAYSDAEVLLLFGDREEGLARGRAAALRAGCRVAVEAPIARGAERFDQQIGCDAALVTAAGPSADFDLLLNRVGAAARAGRVRGVVVAPFDMIDAICAMDLPGGVEHLVDPTDAELERAVALAAERTSSQLHDVNKGDGSVLQQLSEEAARFASVLASLSGSENGSGPVAGDGADGTQVDAAFVRSIIRARRLRNQYFQNELFADPGFDMLLDLYTARLENSRVAVSSLCIAAAVPATTALRWIRALTEQGLFIRNADPEDGRRIYISLADDTARAMGRYLAVVQKTGLPAV